MDLLSARTTLSIQLQGTGSAAAGLQDTGSAETGDLERPTVCADGEDDGKSMTGSTIKLSIDFSCDVPSYFDYATKMR